MDPIQQIRKGQDEARQDEAWQDEARQDDALQDDALQDRARQIRTRVVEEAANLFGRYGYDVASLDLVVHELRLRDAPDIFDDAETLAKAAFDYGMERADRVLDEAMLAREGPLDQLVGLICGFRGLVEYPPVQGGCPLFCVSPNAPGAFSFMRSSAQEAVSRWRHRIRRLVREGIKLGVIRPTVDPEEVSSIFMSTLEGALAMYLLYDDPSHLERAQRHLSSYVSNARNE